MPESLTIAVTMKIITGDENGNPNPNDPNHRIKEQEFYSRDLREYDNAQLIEPRYCAFCKEIRVFISAKEQWAYDGPAGLPPHTHIEDVARCAVCGHEPGHKGN